MDYEVQLKLQAFLDDELPEAEKRELASLLAREQEAAGLLGELRNTRQALAGFENGIKLPESREFYWSKIQRQIEREPQAAPAEPTASLVARLWRYLMPAAAVAAMAVAALLVYRPTPNRAETEILLSDADADAMTYRDYDAGATVVWFSYPADSDSAQKGSPSIVQ